VSATQENAATVMGKKFLWNYDSHWLNNIFKSYLLQQFWKQTKPSKSRRTRN